MYLSIVVLPLLSSIICGFLGRFLGKEGTSVLAPLTIFICAILSWIIFFEVGLSGSYSYIKVCPWIYCEFLYISWGFLFDSVTCVMLIIITNVSFLVHLYTTSYMESDPHKPRFLAYLNLFTFFMLILVTADNFVQMFVGWEGVGLVSYLLISFWFTRLNANQSAIKALIVNRVGDLGLCVAMFLIYYTFKSLEYEVIFTLVPSKISEYFYFCGISVHSLTAIGVCIFIGATGKSAQLGLHTWLPDAMEGPTPVSALIHAATMVTAGVFLLVRCSPLIEYAPLVLTIIAIIGGSTAIFAASIGGFQYDLKKVIAFSTTSQLGYMVFACGLSKYNVSMFHLANHAFFKALLFLSAGSIIHSLADEQDMRRMGGLVQLLPFTYSAMLIGSLSLAGFPFLTGFYSKDFILELAAIIRYTVSNGVQANFVYWLGCLSVFFTAFYSFRLIFLTFINQSNLSRSIIYGVHEAPLKMLIPLVILVFGSIFLGYLGKDLFIGLGTDFWSNSLFIYPTRFFLIEPEELDLSSKFLPFFLSISGIFVALITNNLYPFSVTKLQLSKFGRIFTFFINKKWFWDKLNNDLIIYPLSRFGYYVSLISLDRGLIEFLGPYGISHLLSKWATNLTRLQTGQIVHYILFMVLGIFLLLNINILHDFYVQIFDPKLMSLFFCTYIFLAL
uniref:NADH dehydrogenase subunit 5 n=1 Tax=Pseudoerythrocladia kornmannii TaxID=753682 RepID=UPI001FCCE9CF|nr:NADH dehydrogenase subunit 5 [Pseudoerythrocladia kornmannii]UNJ19027.1 NADH dehydrogenase subunit 5 [Pseudoerythrocladia kornmannii]